MTVTVSHTQCMFDDALASIGSDCCEGQHADWEFYNTGWDRHHRHVAEWICSGCGRSVVTEVERDRLNHPIYIDPDGTIIEMARPNRPRRR